MPVEKFNQLSSAEPVAKEKWFKSQYFLNLVPGLIQMLHPSYDTLDLHSRGFQQRPMNSIQETLLWKKVSVSDLVKVSCTVFVSVMVACTSVGRICTIFVKVVKLYTLMQQVTVRCQSKNITWNHSMACWNTIIGLLSVYQVECMSSLSSLWFKWQNI